MSWKDGIQLRDLDPGQAIEITCRRCARSRYEPVAGLLEQDEGMRYVYLGELETRLACKYRGCRGRVRISLTNADETDGFVGGLP